MALHDIVIWSRNWSREYWWIVLRHKIQAKIFLSYFFFFRYLIKNVSWTTKTPSSFTTASASHSVRYQWAVHVRGPYPVIISSSSSRQLKRSWPPDVIVPYRFIAVRYAMLVVVFTTRLLTSIIENNNNAHYSVYNCVATWPSHNCVYLHFHGRNVYSTRIYDRVMYVTVEQCSASVMYMSLPSRVVHVWEAGFAHHDQVV